MADHPMVTLGEETVWSLLRSLGTEFLKSVDLHLGLAEFFRSIDLHSVQDRIVQVHRVTLRRWT